MNTQQTINTLLEMRSQITGMKLDNKDTLKSLLQNEILVASGKMDSHTWSDCIYTPELQELAKLIDYNKVLQHYESIKTLRKALVVSSELIEYMISIISEEEVQQFVGYSFFGSLMGSTNREKAITVFSFFSDALMKQENDIFEYDMHELHKLLS